MALEQTASFELGFVLDGKAVAEAGSDGKLRIEGYAATLGLDRKDEAFLPGVFEKGLDKYFRENPVLLYHHQTDKALGTVEEVKLDAKGLFVRAALDPPTVGDWSEDVYNKVKSGTIKGFSIGGIFKRKMTPQGMRVHEADFAEVSVTPLPLEPGSLFALAGKAFGSDSEEEKALVALTTLFDDLEASAEKVEGKSYLDLPPLTTPGDIAKAVDRCRDGVESEEAIRARIIREAEALDVMVLIPDEWLNSNFPAASGDLFDKCGTMLRMDFTEQIDALSTKAQDILEKLEGKSLDADALTELKEQVDGLSTEFAELKTAVTEGAGELEGKAVSELMEKFEALQPELTKIADDRKAAEAELERKAMIEQMNTLGEAVTAAAEGKALPNFFPSGPASDPDVYGSDGEHSYFNDVRLSRAGDTKARGRIDDYFEGKAMGEGIDTNGGFLVPPEVSDALIPLRDASGVLRQLFTSQPIESDTIRFVAQDSGLAVAWTAEFAEKIQSDLSFSEFEAHVYTAAGLATVSNQLLKDAKWNVDQLITADLAKRFVSLEEQAFINGSGSGQPLGIMNTPGVIPIPYADGSPTQQELLDKIAEGVTEVHSQFLGFPNAIVMHPRTWGWLASAHNAEGVYLLGAGASGTRRKPNEPIPGYASGTTPRGELFGLPVYTTPNMPTNLGDADDESAVIVGDFSQGLILDREGITTDTSSHVFFTSNQTVFRSEERLGFTAGRYPNAFAVIQGDGLKGH